MRLMAGLAVIPEDYPQRLVQPLLCIQSTVLVSYGVMVELGVVGNHSLLSTVSPSAYISL